jgi:hypothetical protein
MIFHEETQKGKPLLLMNERQAPTPLYMLFYLSYNLDEAATSVSSAPIEWKLQLPDVQAPTCTGDFKVSPCSSLQPRNPSLSLRTCKPTLYLLLQSIHHSIPLCLYNHIKIHSSPLDICYIFIISSHCPCIILFWFYIHL